MLPVEYDIRAITQRTSECLQTAATQLISFFEPTVTVAQVLDAVPVYVENGEKIGTSPGHVAAYLAQRGYHTTAYIFDVELFDQSWQSLEAGQVVAELRKRQQHIPEHSWLASYHHIIVAGWELFADSGGTFEFPTLNAQLLHNLLTTAPFLMIVNSTYLNQQAKKRYDTTTDAFVSDAVAGRSLTHAVTCAGYRDGHFLIVDPNPPADVDPHRWIRRDHLIASIMAAQSESDNLLISVTRSSK